MLSVCQYTKPFSSLLDPCENRFGLCENRIGPCEIRIGPCEIRIGSSEIRFDHYENKIDPCETRFDLYKIERNKLYFIVQKMVNHTLVLSSYVTIYFIL